MCDGFMYACLLRSLNLCVSKVAWWCVDSNDSVWSYVKGCYCRWLCVIVC